MTHKPTDEKRQLVAEFYLAGCTQEQIARYLGIEDDTLRKYYSEQLEYPLMEAKRVLTNNLFNDAVNGDKDARKFFLTHRGGWYPAKPTGEEDKGSRDSLLEKIIDKIPKHE